MGKRLSLLAALWQLVFTGLSATAADSIKKPDGATVTEQPRETSGGASTNPVAKKETKPGTDSAKKQGVIDTEAELETDCNSQ